MKLLVSYHHIGPNWYVGVFYEKVYEYLKTLKDIEVEYIPMSKLSKKYGSVFGGYKGNVPSIFNGHNLIIQNVENNKTFVHSWNDYAPLMMSENSGIENFDVVKFSCVSSLTQEYYDRYSPKYNITPSFYILEEWNEHDYIELYRHQQKNNNKLFFNGLCHGIRPNFKNLLENTKFFEFKDKRSPGNYKDKENYYKEMSEYKHGFNLDGVAKICYRDIEYFGMGIVLFREKLNIIMNEPIIENEHYFNIIDDEIKNSVIRGTNQKETLEMIEHKLENIFNNHDIESVIKNARGWFERNTLPKNQLETFIGFMENFKIFE
jgi:hypothetical protein